MSSVCECDNAAWRLPSSLQPDRLQKSNQIPHLTAEEEEAEAETETDRSRPNNCSPV